MLSVCGNTLFACVPPDQLHGQGLDRFIRHPMGESILSRAREAHCEKAPPTGATATVVSYAALPVLLISMWPWPVSKYPSPAVTEEPATAGRRCFDRGIVDYLPHRPASFLAKLQVGSPMLIFNFE
jgi:hypothetical protein